MIPLSSNHDETLKKILPMPAAVRNWYAVHTASNHEKRVAQHLRTKEVETFLPQYTVTKRWKNRTTAKVELPLFAGYVFARIARAESIRVLEVPMVYSIVGNRREPSPIPDREIEQLRVALQGGRAHPFPYVKVGHRVRIRSGAFAGLEGIVARTYGSLSVVLSVEMIQKSVAVHVEADELESAA